MKIIDKILRRKRSNAVTSSLQVGVNVQMCKDCQKHNKGMELYSIFAWDNIGKMLRFDKENQRILINEQMLMRAIQLVNPYQDSRELAIVSKEEWFGLKK